MGDEGQVKQMVWIWIDCNYIRKYSRCKVGNIQGFSVSSFLGFWMAARAVSWLQPIETDLRLLGIFLCTQV